MQPESKHLDELQSAYNAAVEEWIAAIREEEEFGLGESLGGAS